MKPHSESNRGILGRSLVFVVRISCPWNSGTIFCDFHDFLNKKRRGNSPEPGYTKYEPVFFDMDPLGDMTTPLYVLLWTCLWLYIYIYIYIYIRSMSDGCDIPNAPFARWLALLAGRRVVSVHWEIVNIKSQSVKSPEQIHGCFFSRFADREKKQPWICSADSTDWPFMLMVS